jgi:hypothetical protein
MAHTKAYVSAKIAASADKVWDVLGGFNNLPAIMPKVIAKSELDRPGVVRTLTIKGASGKIHERLLKYDAKNYIQEYRVLDTPKNMVPFTDYTATIRVKQSSSRSSTIEWSSRFKPKKGVTEDEARAFAHNVYETGIEGTKKKLGLAKRKQKTAAKAEAKPTAKAKAKKKTSKTTVRRTRAKKG